jgi:VanZ family protein
MKLPFYWTGWKWVALLWFVIMCVLFFLPGSDLPKEKWLDKIFFDKWVHIGLFAVLIFLVRFNLPFDHPVFNYLLLLMAFSYGLSVEFIQKYWVPNRSFDLWDVAADMTGAFAGLWYWLTLYKKNKPL